MSSNQEYVAANLTTMVINSPSRPVSEFVNQRLQFIQEILEVEKVRIDITLRRGCRGEGAIKSTYAARYPRALLGDATAAQLAKRIAACLDTDKVMYAVLNAKAGRARSGDRIDKLQVKN